MTEIRVNSEVKLILSQCYSFSFVVLSQVCFAPLQSNLMFSRAGGADVIIAFLLRNKHMVSSVFSGVIST